LKRVIERAWLSISRRFGKTIFLFLIVFILGVLTSGAISVGQAIQQTEINLRRRVPPLATIIQDNESLTEYETLHGETTHFEWLTPDIFEAIGNLPYVQAFNYSVIGRDFFSRELILPRESQIYSINELSDLIEFSFQALERYNPNVEDIQAFRLKGVSHPAIIDIEEGVLDLVQGRTFTTEEMSRSDNVALISEAFAQANNLQLGDTFYLENIIFDEFMIEELAINQIELEIIGIFTPTVELHSESDLLDIENHVSLSSLIYVPIDIAKTSTYFALDYFQEHNMALFFELEEQEILYEDIIFVLYDSLDLTNFNERATEIIPDFWRMNDLTDAFSDMNASMETLQDIALLIIVGSVVASIIVLSLLIVLSLHDRREEIGTYLALGERKIYVILQIFIELFATATIAIILSLFIGNILASNISQEMLRNDLVANTNDERLIQMGGWNNFNTMGHGFEMTTDEMLEAYSVSLDTPTILTFFSSFTITILFSTIIPVFYLVKLNPKEILMKGVIG